MKEITENPADVTAETFINSLEPMDFHPSNIINTIKQAFDQGYSFGSRYISELIK